MRVRLKGINKITKRLADGTVRTYYYAWKGGPALRGKPGSPEFVASYNEAVAKKITPPSGTIHSILRGYQASDDFTQLRDRTRADYIVQIKKIETKFGDFPLSALTDRRTRGVFMDWRDAMATTSRRQAAYAWTVLALVLAWAKDRGKVAVNPCEKGGRIYRGNRRDKVWTADDEANFLAKAPKHLHLPLMLGLWTGQREGDLLRLPWSAYDGTHIQLKQSKTGARIKIPVGAPLKAMLDEAAKSKTSPIILLNSRKRPWSENVFSRQFGKARAKAGIVGVTFGDLRGTAVTRLAVIGKCTEAEIAYITGHSLRDVRSILDANYLHRDPALGESAIRKLEQGTKVPN